MWYYMACKAIAIKFRIRASATIPLEIITDRFQANCSSKRSQTTSTASLLWWKYLNNIANKSDTLLLCGKNLRFTNILITTTCGITARKAIGIQIFPSSSRHTIPFEIITDKFQAQTNCKLVQLWGNKSITSQTSRVHHLLQIHKRDNTLFTWHSSLRQLINDRHERSCQEQNCSIRYLSSVNKPSQLIP